MGKVMLPVLFWLFWFILWGHFLRAASLINNHQKSYVPKECRFTRYPKLCTETMLEMDSINAQASILPALVNKTLSETITSLNFATLRPRVETRDINDASHDHVTGYCKRLMSMSIKRLEQSLSAIKESPKQYKQDIQIWLSAAMTYQHACKDSVASFHLPTNDPTMSLMSKKMDYLSQLASISLSLVNRITNAHEDYNNVTGQDSVRDDIFPNWVSRKNRKLLQAKTIKANAVVAQDGSGNYKTVSEAIRAASGNGYVIYVKAGVYKEKINTNKDGIILIGDGKYSTIITGHDSVSAGSSMHDSATFTITGDGFMARDIGFQNTAGPKGDQALALRIASDHSVLYSCSISGYQDTLLAEALRQFYSLCDISGTVDFIFGNAAAVFQNCNIKLLNRGVILANGRTDPSQETGFVLQRCKITGTPSSGESYLGRPWTEYSRAVIMQSVIDGVIASKGWKEWPGNEKYGKTLYFAEFENTGPGAGLSKRVQWPGFHVIRAGEAMKFTVGTFIKGTSWLPSTGTAFISGL